MEIKSEPLFMVVNPFYNGSSYFFILFSLKPDDSTLQEEQLFFLKCKFYS